MQRSSLRDLEPAQRDGRTDKGRLTGIERYDTNPNPYMVRTYVDGQEVNVSAPKSAFCFVSLLAKEKCRRAC